MARELPYRNKPTPEFSYTADLAQNTTFYVVNQ